MDFESFLGNPRAVQSVREILARDRIPSALLFAGPDGVGKKTLALMLAKALFCERRPAGGSNFCGECGRCRKTEEMVSAARDDLARRREIKDAERRVEGLVYFDLQLIEPLTRFILAEQVRQARSVAYTRPFEFPRRVLIFDQAQAIHWQAVDILLKLLEEPPETTTLVLVCPNAYELRSTIRSRCFRVQFVRVEDDVIAGLLTREKKVPKGRIPLAARLSAGSVARAKSLDLAEFERRRRPWIDYLRFVATARVPSRGLGASEGGNLKAAPDFRLLFDSTRALTDRNENFEETLRIGSTLLRDLVLTLEGGASQEVVNVDLVKELEAWARPLGVAGIEKLKRGLDQAYRLQKRNVNQQVGLEALALEVAGAPAAPAMAYPD